MNDLANTITTHGDTPAGTLPLTIADAERILATWTDLAPRRMQKMRSALSTAARILAPTERPGERRPRVPIDCPTLEPAAEGAAGDLRHVPRTHDEPVQRIALRAASP